METARQLLAIALVLALAGTARWILRREAGMWSALRRGREKIQALEASSKIALTPQHSLHAVRAGACEWILVTHPQGCTVLHESKSNLHESKSMGAAP